MSQHHHLGQPSKAFRTSDAGAVASGHASTTQAAEDILRQGGNAYDAVIAGVLVACAAEPVLASLGGGGFFIGKQHNQNAQCLDFFTQSPINPPHPHHLQEKVTVNFTNASQDFYIGAASTATPGVVKGLFEIHQQFGKLPIKDIFSHASTLIRNGIMLNQAQHNVLSLVEKIYLYSNDARSLYQSKQSLDSVNILQPKEYFYNNDLANTIDALAMEGSDYFYQGDIANSIHDFMKDNHGSIQIDDLQAYQSIWRKPLHYQLNHLNDSMDIYANNSPAIGGYYVKSILSAYQKRYNKEVQNSSINHLNIDWHYRTLANHLSQLFHTPVSPENFKLGDEDNKVLNAIFNSRKIAPKGTTHITVTDKDHNMAAITLSNGEGNGFIIPKTGIMLNNMLGEDDVNPLAPHSWVCNQRLSSMMTPTIAIQNQHFYCLGTGGSNRIPTALAQTIIQLFFYKKSLKDAIEFPRIHFDKLLSIETHELIDCHKLFSGIDEVMNVFNHRDFYFGGVNAVLDTGSGNKVAHSDSRRI